MFKLTDNYKIEKRISKLKEKESLYQAEIEGFIHRFVELYNHYMYLANKENKTKFNLYLKNYRIKVYQEYIHSTFVLIIYNKKKKLLKISSSWGNSFDKPEIIIFNSKSVFELQEFHNLFVDLIQQMLNQKEEKKNDIDLENLSLKELL